jgi:hypothetical protein
LLKVVASVLVVVGGAFPALAFEEIKYISPALVSCEDGWIAIGGDGRCLVLSGHTMVLFGKSPHETLLFGGQTFRAGLVVSSDLAAAVEANVVGLEVGLSSLGEPRPFDLQQAFVQFGRVNANVQVGYFSAYDGSIAVEGVDAFTSMTYLPSAGWGGVRPGGIGGRLRAEPLAGLAVGLALENFEGHTRCVCLEFPVAISRAGSLLGSLEYTTDPFTFAVNGRASGVLDGVVDRWAIDASVSLDLELAGLRFFGVVEDGLAHAVGGSGVVRLGPVFITGTAIADINQGAKTISASVGSGDASTHYLELGLERRLGHEGHEDRVRLEASSPVAESVRVRGQLEWSGSSYDAGNSRARIGIDWQPDRLSQVSSDLSLYDDGQYFFQTTVRHNLK